MFSLLPGVPGLDDLRGVARRIDTARHHGVPDGVVLELDLQALPHETGGFDPLALIRTGGQPPVLRDVVDAIHRAADDPRVVGLIARVQLSAAAAGPVQELRAAIAEFSALKPSLAWAETYPGTLSYYLASAFGEVWMQPSGTVGLIGFATNATFLRTALDKAGIEAQFFARGEYKSAANMFTQDAYTDAHREADTALVESLHAQVREAVADRATSTPPPSTAGRPGAVAARRRTGIGADRPDRVPRPGLRADRRTGRRAGRRRRPRRTAPAVPVALRPRDRGPPGVAHPWPQGQAGDRRRDGRRGDRQRSGRTATVAVRQSQRRR
jgi:Periplasmic serine proteases (ClpP class)